MTEQHAELFYIVTMTTRDLFACPNPSRHRTHTHVVMHAHMLSKLIKLAQTHTHTHRNITWMELQGQMQACSSDWFLDKTAVIDFVSGSKHRGVVKALWFYYHIF